MDYEPFEVVKEVSGLPVWTTMPGAEFLGGRLAEITEAVNFLMKNVDNVDQELPNRSKLLLIVGSKTIGVELMLNKLYYTFSSLSSPETCLCFREKLDVNGASLRFSLWSPILSKVRNICLTHELHMYALFC